MIAAIKRGLLRLMGIVPSPDWQRQLRRRGYYVAQRAGAWHWYHPESQSFSGSYTTSSAAWRAAQDNEFLEEVV